jgi:hypothetical protein
MKLYNVNEPGEYQDLARQLTKVMTALTDAKKHLLNQYVEEMKPSFQQWLDMGVKYRYCEEIHCMSHESPMLNQVEDQAFQAGYDACVPLIRVHLEGDSPCSSI